MIQRLIANWKTTSAGVIMIIGAIVHLFFNRPLTEPMVMMGVTAIIGGLGLLFAGDANVSAVAADKNAVAIDRINALGSDPGSPPLSVTPKPLEPPAETRPTPPPAPPQTPP
jgi:hypothetical protein